MAQRDDLKYTAEHEWLLVEAEAGSGTAVVGITSYAAGKLGDVVFVELPAVGTDVTAGSVVGEIESTKSVGELFAPIDGTVIEANDAVVDSPELVNADPFGEGWLIKLKYTDLPDGLLTGDEYNALVGE